MNQKIDCCFNINSRTPSEFLPGGYDIANISEAMDTTISTVFEYFRHSRKRDYSYSNVLSKVIFSFNEEFIHRLDEASFASVCKNANDGARKLKQLIIYDELLSDEEKDHPDYVRTFYDNYDAVIKRFCDDRCFYDIILANNYLDSFFELSKNVVFCPNSINITSTTFRKSGFLQTLISFASKEIACETKSRDNSSRASFLCYELSFFDPFAYDTISRALTSAVRLIIDELDTSKYCEELFTLRKNMFVCGFESAFQRVFTLGGQSYRVELNRHTSKLIAYPIERLSSISDTKTIRLFEKTAAYIQNNYIHDNQEEEDYSSNHRNNIMSPCPIFVTLIGHSEISNGEYESSMTDYLDEVLHWYDSLKIPGKPKLDLRLRNILSESGKPDILDGDIYLLPEKRERIPRSFNGHKAECIFKPVNYELTFTYGLKEIKKLINQSDLIFILDCPWISTENYSITKEEPLNDYCYRLQKLNWEIPYADRFSILVPGSFFTESPMVELNGQYNRIMSSTSLSSGSVVRSMRDDLIREIQRHMDDLRQCCKRRAKELYIFSSENEGVDYSYIKSYPLTRLEQYDGKRFTIIQFTTKRLPMLQCRISRKEKLRFEIDVWSIMKYLCFSFAYRYPVNSLLSENDLVLHDSFDSFWLNDPIRFLELMQSIVVAFDLSNSLRKIRISLVFSGSFDKIVKSLDFDSNLHNQSEYARLMIKKSIGKKILKLIKPLYRDVVFSKSKHYGDEAIKLGFKMTLYSAARDVNTMLFYHLYEVACNKEDFSFFNVSFDGIDSVENITPAQPRDYYEAGFFVDKKLYCTLFNSLERDHRLYMGMVKMLSESKTIYDLDESLDRRFVEKLEKRLFNNIEIACSHAKLDDTIMFRNLLRAQYTINS